MDFINNLTKESGITKYIYNYKEQLEIYDDYIYQITKKNKNKLLNDLDCFFHFCNRKMFVNFLFKESNDNNYDLYFTLQKYKIKDLIYEFSMNYYDQIRDNIYDNNFNIYYD